MNCNSVRAATIGLALAAILLFTASARAADDAEELYKSKCAPCHGADGAANTAVGKSMKIRDFHSADVQKQSDAQLTDFITGGKGAMPAYKGKLTDDQIKQMVRQVREIGKK